jgi:nitrous oxidase accessory protein NosD
MALLIIGMLTLAFRIQPVKAQPPTIIVPDDYPTIQAAINSANNGDTVFVRSGTYYENVVVNKTLNLIGENRNSTIVDGNNTGNVVTLVSNNVNVCGFTFRKSAARPRGRRGFTFPASTIRSRRPRGRRRLLCCPRRRDRSTPTSSASSGNCPRCNRRRR